jgi:hypothetical protein
MALSVFMVIVEMSLGQPSSLVAMYYSYPLNAPIAAVDLKIVRRMKDPWKVGISLSLYVLGPIHLDS